MDGLVLGLASPAKAIPTGRTMGLLNWLLRGIPAGEEAEPSGKARDEVLRRTFDAIVNNDPASAPPGDLIFKSGESALEYIYRYMKIDWVTGASIPALVVEDPALHLGTARVAVRIPHPTERFVDLVTISMIRAVHTRTEGRLEITDRSTVGALNLKLGDMVMILLGASDGFPSFIQKRLVDPPALSVRATFTSGPVGLRSISKGLCQP